MVEGEGGGGGGEGCGGGGEEKGGDGGWWRIGGCDGAGGGGLGAMGGGRNTQKLQISGHTCRIVGQSRQWCSWLWHQSGFSSCSPATQPRGGGAGGAGGSGGLGCGGTDGGALQMPHVSGHCRRTRVFFLRPEQEPSSR